MSESLVAQLSSISYSVEDFAKRVNGLAEGERTARHEDIASALDEVERSFRTGVRRLERIVHELDHR